MLTLELESDEWIVLRDMRTKKEYGRFRRKKDSKKKILFEAPKSTEIRRYPIDERELALSGRRVCL